MFVIYLYHTQKVFALRGKEPNDLFNVMVKGYKRRSLTGCSIKPDPDVHEAKTDMGLVMGHAYTVSKVVDAKTFSFDTLFSYSKIICVPLFYLIFKVLITIMTGGEGRN